VPSRVTVALLVLPTFADVMLRGAEPAERFDIRGGIRSRFERVAQTAPAHWIAVKPTGGGATELWGPGLVVRSTAMEELVPRLRNAGVKLRRRLSSETAVFETPDAPTAAALANRLGAEPGLLYAAPERRRGARLQYTIAPAPNDPYYGLQAHLETAPTSPGPLPFGADVNAREAWVWTRAEAVHIAVADDGVRLDHADLAQNAGGASFNFTTGLTGGAPGASFQFHGTAVAGLAAARGGNGLGVTGAAPLAILSSWVIFDADDQFGTDAQLAEMWRFGNSGTNAVEIQNHSWANSDFEPLEISPVEEVAIDDAVSAGRGGRGVIILRAAGNDRRYTYSGAAGVGDANTDGYAADPRQITVGAVRSDGRAASYSVRGACVRVAAPGGDPDFGYPGLVTTDLPGVDGLNAVSPPGQPDGWDYTLGDAAFSGTSAAAPVVSGIAALALGVNPNLGWRDMALLLSLAARQRDLADPDLSTNGAGFAVSHNTGFGVPDAGVAVRLAKVWSNRPPSVKWVGTNATAQPIPDDGLGVSALSGDGTTVLATYPASGSDGLQPDVPTPWAPWNDSAAGSVTNAPRGGALLVDRGTGMFSSVIKPALAAHSGLAVIIDNLPGDQRETPGGLDYAPVTAVTLGAQSGAALRSLLSTHTNVTLSAHLGGVQRTFHPNLAMVVESVRVTVAWIHPRFADLRVTLRSPGGMTSVLSRAGGSTNAAPDSWTFSSVRSMGEGSLGDWVVQVSDEAPGAVGTLSSVALELTGCPIMDTDADGLDDRWEMAYFGTLAYGPADDPDQDGWNNAAEQLIGTNPAKNDAPLVTGIQPQAAGWLRLAWPGRTGPAYNLESAPAADGPWTPLGQTAGKFPEMGQIIAPGTNTVLFRVRSAP
jgi:subtilisin family serine protease/subtilisin-like proprotein convertase family protein